MESAAPMTREKNSVFPFQKKKKQTPSPNIHVLCVINSTTQWIEELVDKQKANIYKAKE